MTITLSEVGEANVVEKNERNRMCNRNWWEGNGGAIYPELHYGRDAGLIGIVLFLTQLAERKLSVSDLRKPILIIT